jgi:hypothetical protein
MIKKKPPKKTTTDSSLDASLDASLDDVHQIKRSAHLRLSAPAMHSTARARAKGRRRERGSADATGRTNRADGYMDSACWRHQMKSTGVPGP